MNAGDHRPPRRAAALGCTPAALGHRRWPASRPQVLGGERRRRAPAADGSLVNAFARAGRWHGVHSRPPQASGDQGDAGSCDPNWGQSVSPPPTGRGRAGGEEGWPSPRPPNGRGSVLGFRPTRVMRRGRVPAGAPNGRVWTAGSATGTRVVQVASLAKRPFLPSRVASPRQDAVDQLRCLNVLSSARNCDQGYCRRPLPNRTGQLDEAGVDRG